MNSLAQPATSTKHAPNHILPLWLRHLGPLGVLAVAFLDSSIIPFPIPGSTDLLVLLLVAQNSDPFLLVGLAVAGNLMGGYTCWYTGKKGGEAALHKHIKPHLMDRISHWVKRHAILSLVIPSLLPPPFAIAPFLIASGALGVSRARFLRVLAIARAVRFGLIAWLASVYGRSIARSWPNEIHHWSPIIFWCIGGIVVAGLCFALLRLLTGNEKRKHSRP